MPDSTAYSAATDASWKTWDSRLRKAFLRPQKLARRTNDNGCLFWPTPNVAGGGIPPGILIRKGNHFVRPSSKMVHLGLDRTAKMWPTPMASDSCKPSAGNRKPADLTHASRSWPTPAARDAKGANSREPPCTSSIAISFACLVPVREVLGAAGVFDVFTALRTRALVLTTTGLAPTAARPALVTTSVVPYPPFWI